MVNAVLRERRQLLGGWLLHGADGQQAFVVNEKNGVWGTAVEVPGTAALNTNGQAAVTALACASAGNCSAGGQYRDMSGVEQVFIVSEKSGVWGNAIEVPGSAAFATQYSTVRSLSCATAGYCVATGWYASGVDRAFLVRQAKGKWGIAAAVPGTASLGPGGSAPNSVSCARAGRCAIGGLYADSQGAVQAFVTAP